MALVIPKTQHFPMYSCELIRFFQGIFIITIFTLFDKCLKNKFVKIFITINFALS